MRPSSASVALTRELEQYARHVLQQALAREPGMIKVHAAEAFVALGELDRVRTAFALRGTEFESTPARTGLWRVLAAVAQTPAECADNMRRIEHVFLDPAATDRLQALESLCKLCHAPDGAVLEAARQLADHAPERDTTVGLWARQLAGDACAVPRLAALLSSPDPVSRLRAAYVLRWIKIQDPDTVARLAQSADEEPAGSTAQPYLLSAALLLAPASPRAASWKSALQHVLANGPAGARYEACQALMHHASAAELPQFTKLFDSAEGDPRIGAAWAVLHVLNGRRAQTS